MLKEFKKLLGIPLEETNGLSSTVAAAPLTQPAQNTQSAAESSSAAADNSIEIRGGYAGKYYTVEQRAVSFDDIYDNAAVKPAHMSYNILKVAEMVSSPHLVGMAPDAKRSSLLMALEAAEAEIEDLLQDAVVRQRALNDFESEEQGRLREFEIGKAEENRRLQAAIQNNLDEVARAQDSFRAWQKRKQQEAHRIAEAAAYCVPQNNAANGGNLTTVLERAVAFGR